MGLKTFNLKVINELKLFCLYLANFFFLFWIRRCGLFPFRINSEIINHTDRSPWMGDQPSQDRCTHTHTRTQENTKTEIRKHPYLVWDSNPQSQCFSGREYFVSYVYER
jgi:hypothetical protein